MWQRAFYLLYEQVDLDELFRLDEVAIIEKLRTVAAGGPATELLNGIFGPTRDLYKRLGEYHVLQSPSIHQRLARRPYPELVQCSEQLATELSQRVGTRIAPHEILIDAPPVSLEVEFELEVYSAKEDTYHMLADVSPVVQTLAKRQFDDYVKRVRVFVHPRLREMLNNVPDIDEPLEKILSEFG